ncbi:helix-turn-helix transcriptional regulator [Methylobacterium gregans]|uniref:HTH-type transcriptional activator RhaS n=1 Tax=Methylobacterium gregans TaxID=374424 RepID=A0AA37MIT4_9HYPH|nr:helix-turn-helix transcriptional regulator [Methylobacterium gregans]MDQ0524306.1 AraC-like DNA-binding protein [Methylobacterium gregans]GJD81931.1 HTH-type transcriptional activator RhaS [Methylobacterium gregans]GLS57295.1 hypothetical protein GCM10007886_54810 [Methylobacterium gregans]
MRGTHRLPGALLRVASIDVAVLTWQFGLSRRSLYRLFGDAGGVQAHIRERRLAQAWRELAKSGGRHPKVARLAHACGYADPQSFSQTFRKRCGRSPLEVPPGAPAVAALLQSSLLGWLHDLSR